MNPPAGKFGYKPPLDGLRGLGVLAVVAFHFDALSGGYLGVDLFFVLSGFLITSLLIRESLSAGSISLRNFWERRARRLLPALFVLLLAGAIYAATIASDVELGPIRRDGLAGLFYVNNWVQVGSHAAYFDRFVTPSIFRHLWSLAIEEQFYVVLPLIAGAVLRFARRPVRTLGALSIFAAASSMCAAIWLNALNAPADRLYFGTDTRVGAIMIGAAAACFVSISEETAAVGAVRTLRFGRMDFKATAGRTAFASVALAVLIICWSSLPGEGDLLWKGGLASCSICAAVLVGVMGHDSPGPLARVLSFGPLVWFGKISYGLYLWHWPVRVLVKAESVGVDGAVLFAIRLFVSVCLAVLSYRLIEQPVRHGTARWPVRSDGVPD